VQLEHLPSMVAGVWSDDSNLQLEATTQFRKLLSIGKKFDLSSLMHLLYTNLCFNYSPLFLYQSVALQLRKWYSRALFLALLSFSWGRTTHSFRSIACCLLSDGFFLDVCDHEFNILLLETS